MIFNPGSGKNDESPLQLMDIIKAMQTAEFEPEAYLLQPECDLKAVVREAAAQGIQMIVVCGGDGTISATARAMQGLDITLGIIPTGTQNKISYSLGIPKDIPKAINILRNGQHSKMDIGMITCGEKSMPFLEICSIGLFSSLFQSSDEIQHGNIAKIGDFLATLATFPPSEISFLLDDGRRIENRGHVVLVTNMPYVIRHYQVGPASSFRDGLLDILIFEDISKLELIGYMLQQPESVRLEDHRIVHLQARRVEIDTKPAMSVMADGDELGEGLVQIEVKPEAISVMIGTDLPNDREKSGESFEG